MNADRLKHVTDWQASRLEDRHFGAQLVVLRGGQVILDRSVGSTNRGQAKVTPRDRFIVYSLGKPFAALCVHLLAERGLLSLDKPGLFRNLFGLGVSGFRKVTKFVEIRLPVVKIWRGAV